MTGALSCGSCNRRYAIRSGIPDFVDLETGNDASLEAIKSATVSQFGYEWRHYKDWGWLEAYPDVADAERKFLGALIENTEAAFSGKSMLSDSDLDTGKWVLDAGCGNGRFTNQAARRGANVVGVDIGDGTVSAFAHTRHLENVHILRGDLFNLPLVKDAFDTIFSIGVLMHTGDAEKAFREIVCRVKPGGHVVAHVYGRGRQSYEIIDRTLRAVTVKLPVSFQMLFAKGAAAVARWFLASQDRERYFWQKIYPHINLLPTDHHMFDWWSAPVATHHTIGEVSDWFESAGLTIENSRPPVDDPMTIDEGRNIHDAITVLGRRPLDGR